MTRRDRIERGVEEWTAYYRCNPHHFARDFLHLDLHIFQQILIVMMNICTVVTFIGARGIGKSFLSAVFCVIRCTLYPGTRICIASGVRSQSINVLEKILLELKPMSPELAAEIDEKETQINGTNARIVFKNTSVIKVVTAADSARGKESRLLIISCKKWTEEEIQKLYELYPANGPVYMAEYLGRTRHSVQIKASRLGIRTPSHQVNREYFDVIDSADKAYWLGFLSADGYVVNNQDQGTYEVGIHLSSCDKEHLMTFNECIDGDYTITTHYTKPFVSRGYDTTYETCRIRVYSKHMVESLENYGIVQNKTYSLTIPKLSECYIWDYIRGYFDGDGSFNEMNVKGHTYARVSFVSASEAYLDQLSAILIQHDIIPRKYTDKNNFTLHIRQQDSVRRFCERIYYSDNIICLKRKYNHVCQYYNLQLPA